MKYSIKKTSDIEHEININVSLKLINELTLKKFLEIKNSINISGFRTGKVPISIIKNKYEKKLKSKIISDFLEKNIKEILKKENIKPVNYPTVKEKYFEDNINFIINFETLPKIKIKDLSTLIVKVPEIQIDDKDLNNIIDTLKIKYGEWKIVNRLSEIKDKIIIEYIICNKNDILKTNDWKKIEIEISKTNEIIHLNKKIYINFIGYEKNNINTLKTQLINIKDSNLNSNNNKLNDSIIYFNFKIKSIFEKKLLNSNIELAKLVGSKSDNINHIKNKIKENINKQIESSKKDLLKNNVLNELFKQNKFNLPKSLMKYKKNVLNNDNNNMLDIEIEKKTIIEILIKEIINIEKITVEKIQIKEKLNKIYDNNTNINIKSDTFKSNLINEIKNELLVDNVISFILKKAIVKIDEIKLNDFLSKFQIKTL